MTSKFLSRNGETYRVLVEDKDTCWVISFDDPTRCLFCVSAAEMDGFQRVPAPRDFAPEECDLSLAVQKRLALIQPLLEQNAEAITDQQLRNAAAKGIAQKEHTTIRRVLRLYYRYLATGEVTFSLPKPERAESG